LNDDENLKIKICRNCHSTYIKLSQKYCGNNCQNEHPFLIGNKNNKNIEPRVINLTTDENNIIRWICLGCKKEYASDGINGKDFVCDCGLKNQLYPFTTKSCANDSCKNEENSYHKLPIDGKACEKCGETNFQLNSNKLISSFLYFEDKNLEGPETFKFKIKQPDEEKSKNLPSLTFTILNNNLEYILYGENKSITMKNIINDSMGFIPDNIYEKLLKKYASNNEIFKISYNNETQAFSIRSILNFEVVELDPRYQPKNTVGSWISGSENVIPENKLFELNEDFFKIHIWAY
jgi:ribosomal protein L31